MQHIPEAAQTKQDTSGTVSNLFQKTWGFCGGGIHSVVFQVMPPCSNTDKLIN